MDPRLNPYAPGAGQMPITLAGRDLLIEKASIALYRIRHGRASRSLIFYGLRGVGKTVLLNKIRLDAESLGLFTVMIEAPEERSLPSILIPNLRTLLIKMSRVALIKDKVEKALSALAGFSQVMKIKYGDIEVSLDADKLLGTADSGDLETDLIDLLTLVGEAAQSAQTAIVIFVDELQYVPETQLAALITALHRVVQNQLPVTLIGAGLPQLVGNMGRAKSYAERLFEYIKIAELPNIEAKLALTLPANALDVTYDEAALDDILEKTQAYPYFIQEWGKHCWNIAKDNTITLEDAVEATKSALAELDNSFFRVRFDRLTPSERKYIRAMAELGAGPHRTGDIAQKLGRKPNLLAPTRGSLIKKGMLYAPAHGDAAFTVPLFDGYMKRIMPEFA